MKTHYLPKVAIIYVFYILQQNALLIYKNTISNKNMSSPELQSSSCGNPGVPPKGILYGTRFDVGDKIRYSCVTGYILDGHPQLTCIANSVNTASWDFPVPICRGKKNATVTFLNISIIFISMNNFKSLF